MNKLQNKSVNEEDKNNEGFPWQATFLLIMLVVGGILMVLKVAEVF